MEKSTQEFALVDVDVSSMYPSIILTQGLYPKHLGPAFLDVYRTIYHRRLEAKRLGNKVEAESLKIVLNGTFGKLGSKYSAMYSPDLLIQVTLTGQLALLMLIEMLENAGFEVVSANTDGVTLKCFRGMYTDLQRVVSEWETRTGLKMEETRYRALYQKDVNNYLAIKADGEVKGKGLYANPWSKSGKNIFKLHKNPATTICTEAAIKLLSDGTPIRDTIYNTKDITKFISLRKVDGGAEKDGEFLGKTVRFYYSRDTKSPIRYIRSGNKVPKSEGAKPLMELPESFPKDVHFLWYVQETENLLLDLGYLQGTLF